MNRPLTDKEVLAIDRARSAVQRIVLEVPACLEGDALVHALIILLSCDGDDRQAAFGNVGIAAAAIAELVERDRGERTVTA